MVYLFGKVALEMKIVVASIMLSAVIVVGSVAQEYAKWGLPEGAKLRIGKGNAIELEYLPDGSKLAVATTIGVWFYDTATLRESSFIPVRSGKVAGIAFSPDGGTLTAGNGRGIHLWAVDSGEKLGKFPGSHNVRSVTFDPAGNAIASGHSDGTVAVWDAGTGEQLHKFAGHTSWVNSVAFSPDGITLASGCRKRMIRLWDLNTGRCLRVLNGHTHVISSLAFNRDGATLASGSWDHTVRLWNAKTGEHLRTLRGHEADVYSITFSPDGNTLASSGSYWNIILWDVHTGEVRQKFTWEWGGIISVRFSPDGRTLAAAYSGSSVRLWDVRTGTVVGVLSGHRRDVRSLALSPNGRMVAASTRREAQLWNTETGELLHTLTKAGCEAGNMAFSPDGSVVASGSSEATRLWDVETGELQLRTWGHGATSLAFSPDGSIFATGGLRGTLELWDAGTGEHLRTFHTYRPKPKPTPGRNRDARNHVRSDTDRLEPVDSVAFSPDGDTLAGGGFDLKVRLWNPKTGELKQTLSGHSHWVRDVAFTRDGNRLASASVDRTVRFWDVKTGELQQTIHGLGEFNGVLALSPDGNTLAVGGTRITVLAREAGLWKHRHKIIGHADAITSLAFSSDGETLGSASEDGTVLIWDHDAAPSAALSAVGLDPSWVTSPPLGHVLEYSLVIKSDGDVAGFEATVLFDPTALRYVNSGIGSYFHYPGSELAMEPAIEEGRVTLRATRHDGAGRGAGTLAELSFEVLAVKDSSVKLLDVSLVDRAWNRTYPRIEDGRVVEPPPRHGM